MNPRQLFSRTLRSHRRWCRWLAVSALLLLAGSWKTISVAQNSNSIVFSVHNLSISGPGDLRAATESDICIFCHTPHNATTDGPLWNHGASVASYTPYSSSTLFVPVGQPTGSSRLCLSCHDGTVALGLISSRVTPIAMQGGVSTIPSGHTGYVGTDLSADHPVSFDYQAAYANSGNALLPASTLNGSVRLDHNGQMQCTSCHDPHNNQYGNFLVVDTSGDGSALCNNCHVSSGGLNPPHPHSNQQVPQALQVKILQNQKLSSTAARTARRAMSASLGCAVCHASHGAEGRKQLMNFSDPEKNCLTCHGSAGAAANVAADFNKLSTHPILVNSLAHNKNENLVNPPVRHVVCADCHDPHLSNQKPGAANVVSGSLAGVAGVGASGAIVKKITQEYELCFRCHADSKARGPARVRRQFVQTNTRLQFNPINASYHSVVSPARNASGASLLQPWLSTSVMKCTDCHNNDQGPANGGTGPRGPHGSAYVPLLERNLLFTDGTPYNPVNSALCYKCHSSSVVDSDLPTSWRCHREHLETERANCTTCHDAHASANQPHLINFNTTYVLPYNGVISYVSLGQNHGTCTLVCHDGNGRNKIHNAVNY
jgi:predicted CXXCH cytochrome family protein